MSWPILSVVTFLPLIGALFILFIRGDDEVHTMGMHVMGFRDIVMKRTDIEVQGFDIIEVILYVCRGDKPIDDGHLIADLDGPASTPALRQVIDRCLDHTAELVRRARPLPDQFRSRRFAMEAAFIWRIADRLLIERSRRDPVATRVQLTKGQFAVAGLWGVALVMRTPRPSAPPRG